MTASLEIGLHAAVIATDGGEPQFLTVPGVNGQDKRLSGLPFGLFRPDQHRTLDMGLRGWVEEQTRLRLGYVEQLYTFGDFGRMGGGAAMGAKNIKAIIINGDSDSTTVSKSRSSRGSHTPQPKC